MLAAAWAGWDADRPDLSLVHRFVDALGAPRHVKLQSAGPATLALAHPHVAEGRLVEWAIQRAVDSVALAARRGHTVTYVIDEPGLVARAPLGLDALAKALHAKGARFGVHCCGETNWSGLLSAPVDFVSFDARLSLPSLVGAGESFRRWVERGGALILGVVPTDGARGWERVLPTREILEPIVAATSAARALLERSWLSPACGLARHQPEGVARVIEVLRATRESMVAALDRQTPSSPS